MPAPAPAHSRTASAARGRMAGQVFAEYVIVAGMLAVALFVKVPGYDKSACLLLIEGFRKAWTSFSYTISLPW